MTVDFSPHKYFLIILRQSFCKIKGIKNFNNSKTEIYNPLIKVEQKFYPFLIIELCSDPER